MIRLRFEFVGSYHATPWGHHVNEGLVEWPPSPWRILRALLATGYTKLGWSEVPDEMRSLIEALARCEPTYYLPRATTGHTRHYMPVKGFKKGLPATSKVIDAFVRPCGPLVVEWPATLEQGVKDLLESLLRRLGYLGRAESRVKARMAGETDSLPEVAVTTKPNGRDLEPVRLLAPISAQAYDDWRRLEGEGPEDLLGALQMDTARLQKEKWNSPPGTRELVYWRPADALTRVYAGCGGLGRGSPGRNDTALFALATDTKRDVLPLMERAFPTMALFRQALLAKVGDEQAAGKCPELTGKDANGQPLQFEHRHAHFIPLCLEGDDPKRIDHVLVYAPMGFGELAEDALRRLRKTWAKGIEDIRVTLIGIGKLQEFRSLSGELVPELGTAKVWVSRTPFFPPRFLKVRGKDTIEGQVRAEVLRRGLPDLEGPPVIAIPREDNPAGRRALRFRRFVRTRQGKASRPPAGPLHLTIEFCQPVQGPLCLGWGAHFGLGLFVPDEGEISSGL